MLVLCGRADGLVAWIARLTRFGPLTDGLRRKQIACATVDATFLSRTRPEARIVDVFRAAVDAYAAVGFPGEWQQHHQGGAAGYRARVRRHVRLDRSRLCGAGLRMEPIDCRVQVRGHHPGRCASQ